MPTHDQVNSSPIKKYFGQKSTFGWLCNSVLLKWGHAKKQMSSLSPCFPYSPNLHFMMIDTFLNKWSVNLQNFPTNILFFVIKMSKMQYLYILFLKIKLRHFDFFDQEKKCSGHLHNLICWQFWDRRSKVFDYGQVITLQSITEKF